MLWYLYILFAYFAISVINFIALRCTRFFYCFGMPALAIIVVFLIDLLAAGVVRWILPQKLFGCDKKFFCASPKRAKTYEKLGIKSWKSKIPEWGGLTSFRKNKISDPKNNEYVKRFIVESNYGVAVHFAGMVLGFAVIFIDLGNLYGIGLPVAVINAVYCWLSFAVLRYNLPKLHQLYRINERRAAKIKTEKPDGAETVSACDESGCDEVKTADVACTESRGE